eukprot:1159146-Pelagomonas_calceolata.AAC.3
MLSAACILAQVRHFRPHVSAQASHLCPQCPGAMCLCMLTLQCPWTMCLVMLSMRCPGAMCLCMLCFSWIPVSKCLCDMTDVHPRFQCDALGACVRAWSAFFHAGVASSGLPNGLSSAAAGAPDALPPLDNRSLNKVQDEIEKLESTCSCLGPHSAAPQTETKLDKLSAAGRVSLSQGILLLALDIREEGTERHTLQLHLRALINN